MEPILCANRCGFFGTAKNRNMCSKCYKDFLKREIIHVRELINAREKRLATIDQHNHASSSPSSENNVVLAEITAHLQGLRVGKSRCKSCHKKVGLTGFKCRCGDLFCARHRLPEIHACNVDYKTLPGRNDKDLAETIKADKLESRLGHKR